VSKTRISYASKRVLARNARLWGVRPSTNATYLHSHLRPENALERSDHDMRFFAVFGFFLLLAAIVAVRENIMIVGVCARMPCVPTGSVGCSCDGV
jgi:hypothetical protein